MDVNYAPRFDDSLSPLVNAPDYMLRQEGARAAALAKYNKVLGKYANPHNVPAPYGFSTALPPYGIGFGGKNSAVYSHPDPRMVAKLRKYRKVYKAAKRGGLITARGIGTEGGLITARGIDGSFGYNPDTQHETIDSVARMDANGLYGSGVSKKLKKYSKKYLKYRSNKAKYAPKLKALKKKLGARRLAMIKDMLPSKRDMGSFDWPKVKLSRAQRRTMRMQSHPALEDEPYEYQLMKLLAKEKKHKLKKAAAKAEATERRKLVEGHPELYGMVLALAHDASLSNEDRVRILKEKGYSAANVASIKKEFFPKTYPHTLAVLSHEEIARRAASEHASEHAVDPTASVAPITIIETREPEETTTTAPVVPRAAPKSEEEVAAELESLKPTPSAEGIKGGILGSLIADLAIPLVKEGVSWIADRIQARNAAKNGTGLRMNYRKTGPKVQKAVMKAAIKKASVKGNGHNVLKNAYAVAAKVIPKVLPDTPEVRKKVAKFLNLHVKEMFGTDKAPKINVAGSHPTIQELLGAFADHILMEELSESKIGQLASSIPAGGRFLSTIKRVMNAPIWKNEQLRNMASNVATKVGNYALGKVMSPENAAKTTETIKNVATKAMPMVKNVVDKAAGEGVDLKGVGTNDSAGPSLNMSERLNTDDDEPTSLSAPVDTLVMSGEYAAPERVGPTIGDAFRYQGMNATLVYQVAKKMI